MAIKLIAVDLDGTLLSSNNTILPETQRMLRVAVQNGIKVVLATGRPLSGVLNFAKQLGIEGDDQYAIVFKWCSNSNNFWSCFNESGIELSRLQ